MLNVVALLALGARLEISGPDARQIALTDGEADLAVLTGDDSAINSTVPLRAPDLVLESGASMQ